MPLVAGMSTAAARDLPTEGGAGAARGREGRDSELAHFYTSEQAATRRGEWPFGVVYMNFREHDPPHFHARYQGDEVSVEILTGRVSGTMSRRALGMLFEWMEMHRDGLLRDWQLAGARKTLQPIDPLP